MVSFFKSIDTEYGNWREFEERWVTENNIRKTRGYVNTKFLGFLITSLVTKEYGRYTKKEIEDAFIGILYTISKKLLNSKYDIKGGFITDADKMDMMNGGISRLYEHLYRFDSSKGSAFSFVTALMTSYYKDYLHEKTVNNNNIYHFSNHMRNTGAVVNLDTRLDSEFQSKRKADERKDLEMSKSGFKSVDPNGFRNEDPTVPTLSEATDFYHQLKFLLKDTYNLNIQIGKVRLLTNPNLPVFLRKYKEFNQVFIIELGRKLSRSMNLTKLTTQEKKHIIIVEYVDIKKINESNGYHKLFLYDRVVRARNNGFQYFGIFSDVWNDKDLRKEVVRKFYKMYTDMMSDNFNPKKFHQVALEYIPSYVFQDSWKDRYVVDSYYGLTKERDKRHFLLPGIDEWKKWIDADFDNTRVFDFGRLILDDKLLQRKL